MDTIVRGVTPTPHFLGRCTACREPFRFTLPDLSGPTYTRPCPACGDGTVTGQRLHGVSTRDVCDAACMGAVGPACNCSCDGANHGSSWGGGLRSYEEMTEEEMQARFTALRKLAKTEARRREGTEKRRARREADAAARREAEREAAREAFAEFLAGLTADEWRVIDHVSRWDNVAVYDSTFLEDMHRILARGELLTERQFAATIRTVTRDWDRRAADAEDRASAKPVPTGCHTITGEIVHAEWRENNFAYGGRSDLKMIVRGDGWKVWMTAPRDLLAAVDYDCKKLRGRRVTVTATITPSGEDPAFGFGKHPKGAELLD